MKLGISNIAWNKKDDDEVLEFLLKNNILNIEIAPTKICEHPYDNSTIFENYILNVNNKFNFFSMQSICYGVSLNLFKNIEEHDLLLNHLKKVIRLANHTRIQNIVFGCPKNRNIENIENIRFSNSFFSELDRLAAENKVIIGLEPNPSLYGTNFLNTTIEVYEFITRNKFQNIKINFDLGAFIYNGEKLNDLSSYVDLFSHVHISSPNLEPQLDFEKTKDLLFFLKKNNYKNGISIEMKESTKENIFTTLTKVKSIYDSL